MKKELVFIKLYFKKEKFPFVINMILGLIVGIAIGSIYSGLMFKYSTFRDDIIVNNDYRNTFFTIFLITGLIILFCYFLLSIFIKTYMFKKRKRDYFYLLNKGISNRYIIFNIFLEDISFLLSFILSSNLSSFLIFKHLPKMMNEEFINSLVFNYNPSLIFLALGVFLVVLMNLIYTFYIFTKKAYLKGFKEEN